MICMKIDPDITITELLEAWNNGFKSRVISKLAADHPGLTAMFIVTGILDNKLSRGDCNEVTNRLIDLRVAACQRSS